MRISVLSAVALCVLSCTRSEVDESEQSGLSISLSPNFGRSDADASQSAATRVTSTDFESGDALGLYVVLDGRDLSPSGNAVTNGKMVVGSSGLIAGEGTPIAYPSRSANVHFYSYYPYVASVANIMAHRVGVKVDQTLISDYKVSDFCYGRRMGVAPSATAQPVSYSHKMSQLLINVAAPVNVGDKKVTGVKSAVIYGVKSEADLNFANGVVTTAGVVVDSVKLYRDANVTTSPTGSTTHFTAIIPPQTLAARAGVGGALMSFVVSFNDGSSAYYIYNSLSEVILREGTANVFNLVVGDRGAVSLSGQPSVTAWASVTESGILTQQISNSFTALWRIAIKDYKKIDKVILGINDPILGKVQRHVTTGFSLNADNSADKVIFKFDFTLDAADILNYPYTIDYVEFCEGQDSLRRCSAVVAANVTRRGAYTLGLEAEHLVAVTLGTFDQWDDMLYGDMTRGVDNDFRVSLIEYPHFAEISTLKLRIDGEVYTFNGAGCIAGSNVMVATTGDVRFPDANGRAPYKYPFTIERVELYNSSGGLITGGGYPASIAVNRAGLVTMRMYRGIITSTTASVVGYNSSGGVGRPEFGGTVENNPLRLVYCYGAASDQLSCLDVERVEVVINNQTVVLGGYKSLMTGSALAAQSSAPHVNIASGSGSKPTTYPYYISKVTLKKSDGTMLFTSVLDVPLKVDWFGEVTIEIMEKMASDISESLTIGEVRWATGNLVADGKGGCRIGSPTDGGVYFQFGSLLGWKGGASGDGTGVCAKADGEFFVGTTFNAADEIAVYPSSFTRISSIGSTWPNQTKNLYYFGDAAYAATFASLRDFAGFSNGSISASGVGDPCAYYLGGNWRLPTTEEFKTLTNGGGADLVAADVEWQDSPAGMNFNNNGVKLFIPASGHHDNSDGALYYVGTNGYYWSESVRNASNGCGLNFVNNGVYPQGNNNRRRAFPVRCVQTAPTVPQPPKSDQIVTINGLKWTTGNLVAVGNYNAKVGAPTDGGVYFQFGSLLGWKGGATGDGTGICTVTDGKWFGNVASFNAASEIAVAPSAFSGISAIGTAWPDQTTNLYYFGLDSYATPYSKLSDFSGFASGSLASSGVGDPCRYYLGSPWRQPTATEFRALANNAVNGVIPGAANAEWVTTPAAGLNFNNNSTKYFIPASGRRTTSGALYTVGSYGSYWSESVYNATHGYHLYFTSGNVTPQGSNYRRFGLPVRCVEGVSIYTDPLEWKGADNKGESKDVIVSVGGAVEWTAVASATAGFTAAPLSGKSGDRITLTWTDNTAEGSPARSASVTFTAKGTSKSYTLLVEQASAGPPVNPPAASDYVKIGTLTWTKGSLVAVSGTTDQCKVGAPTDAGLYFQFGSLVGWKSGANGDGTGVTNASLPLEIFTKPSTYGATPAYTACPYFTGGTDANTSVPFATDGGASAIGDPCRFYLGSPWRLPKHTEFLAAGNYQWTTSPAAGRWFGPTSGWSSANAVFFPVSGRRGTSGALSGVGTNGYYWSSTVANSSNGYYLYFSSSYVYPQYSYSRAHGYPVRCVQ